MKPFALILWFAVLACSAEITRGAVTLASLTNPTVQTLIALGTDGVTVGPDRFYDFTFADTSPTGPSATSVDVEPITTNGNGLRFVAAWFASAGNSVASAITYQVSTDASDKMNGVSLFSNGTAPSPSSGTFASASLSTRTLSNTPLPPTLTTYADGITTPTTTASSFFTPQTDLLVADSITVTSSTGVATASIIENTFTPVPDPGSSGCLFIPTVAITATFFRRRKKKPLSCVPKGRHTAPGRSHVAATNGSLPRFRVQIRDAGVAAAAFSSNFSEHAIAPHFASPRSDFPCPARVIAL